MKLAFLIAPLFFISAIACAQAKPPIHAQVSRCNLTVKTAVSAIREYMFHEDPLFKENVVDTDSYIRISVHPAFEDEVFYQIRLVGGMNTDKSVLVRYSIPRNEKYLAKLVETVLKSKPCASVPQLFVSLPIKRTVIPFRKEWDPLFAQLYELRFRTRPYSDEIWLDRTEYELDYVGTNRIRFQSDDYDDPAVKWIINVLNAIDPRI